jgi:hypothetical protein
MARTVIAGVSLVAAIITVLAGVGPAADAVGDAVSALWPIGVVCILAAGCAFLGWLLLQCHQKPAWAESDPEGLNLHREKRAAAYAAILSTSEAYINAHRGLADFDEPGFYVPDLEAAETAVTQANHQFVAARQTIEQYGIDPILEAVQDLEDAVNRNDCDGAATIRRDRLVPAVRQDMNRPMATFL